ncbi:hypothetical protein Glove_88g18 [Diversispora epigaea]|uniref:Uncharacterized protein n=1 Tax=Diversispora epigaea TaxID=1348612 RepID=A0A397J5X8_9GLOM|nr:hypothetical protein Glove_88g18 [Diversispora epigaea]
MLPSPLKRSGAPLTENEKLMIVNIYNYFSGANSIENDHQTLTLRKTFTLFLPIEGIWTVVKGEVACSGPYTNLLSIRNTLLNAFKNKINSQVIVGFWRKPIEGIWTVVKGEVACSGPYTNLLSIRNTLLNAFKNKINSQVIVGFWRKSCSLQIIVIVDKNSDPNFNPFLGFYQYRSKQNDFKFSFRKEANILCKSLKAILNNSSNSKIIESTKSLEESFEVCENSYGFGSIRRFSESKTHTTMANSLYAVYLMILRACCGLQKIVWETSISSKNSNNYSGLLVCSLPYDLNHQNKFRKVDKFWNDIENGYLHEEIIREEKGLHLDKLKMACVVTQGTSKAIATVMENVDISLSDISKHTDKIEDETAKKIKTIQDSSFNLEERDEEQNDKIVRKLKGKLNSGISSIYKDEGEENSLDNSSEKDTAELADVSFNSFVGLKIDNKNYNWKLKNNESEVIEEAKKTEKVKLKLMNVIRLGLSSIIDLSLEFKRGMHSWFGDNWISLKKEILSKINLKVERFIGEVSELITKIEDLCGSYDYLETRKILLKKVME